MGEPGPILAAGQAAIEAALARVPEGDDGAMVGIASPGRVTVAAVTRIPGTSRWHVGASLTKAAEKAEAAVYVSGSWRW